MQRLRLALIGVLLLVLRLIRIFSFGGTVLSQQGSGKSFPILVVAFEYVGDGGEADVVFLDELGHLDFLDVVQSRHQIFYLNKVSLTSSLILR